MRGLSRTRPIALMRRGGRNSSPSGLLGVPVLPHGVSWLVDGTGTGSADSDGNVVLTQLTDRVGLAHFTTSATTSKRPRQIPVDYMVNGRKSVLLDNASSGGASQYLEDATLTRSLWKALTTFELGTGGTLAIHFVPRGDVTHTQVFGCLNNLFTAPGMGIFWKASTAAFDFWTWKNGTYLVNESTGSNAAPKGVPCTVIYVCKPTGGTGGRGSYEIYINGVLAASGSSLAAAQNAYPDHPYTIGAYSDTAGVSGAWGGEFCFGAIWERPLSSGEVTTTNDAIVAWYANPAIAADSGPVSGASVLASVDVAAIGTSIDRGQNDGSGGWLNTLKNTIAPGWGDLTLAFVGANTATGAVIPCMAFDGATIRGEPTLDGFDSISTAHSLRMDTQATTMNGSGVFAPGRKLVITVPIGWANDMRQAIGTSLDHDHMGDLYRMVNRFVTLVRSYDAAHDIRIVLATCTPNATPAFNSEIVAHNRGARTLATALATSTGCPVAVADAYTTINANTATYLDADGIHLTTAGHTALATPMANAIRYVCGLS